MTGVAGGNPDLGPEEAATSTLGVVWTPRFSHPLAANLQLSLDWYRIDIADKIEQIFTDQYVQFCYDAQYNPDFSPTNLWCTMFERDTVTGEIENFLDINQNAFDQETSGVDIQVDWRFDLGPGQVGVNWLASRLYSFETSVRDSSAPSTVSSGTVGSQAVGGSLPDWKFYLRLSYAWRELTVGATWRPVAAMTSFDVVPEYRVPSVSYYDVDASYEVSSGFFAGLRLGLGVENLTDEDPPILANATDANTDPSQYDVIGRRYYVSLSYSF
jgi:outer membrane receptor protein involved in Fe transport